MIERFNSFMLMSVWCSLCIVFFVSLSILVLTLFTPDVERGIEILWGDVKLCKQVSIVVIIIIIITIQIKTFADHNPDTERLGKNGANCSTHSGLMTRSSLLMIIINLADLKSSSIYITSWQVDITPGSLESPWWPFKTKAGGFMSHSSPLNKIEIVCPFSSQNSDFLPTWQKLFTQLRSAAQCPTLFTRSRQ